MDGSFRYEQPCILSLRQRVPGPKRVVGGFFKSIFREPFKLTGTKAYSIYEQKKGCFAAWVLGTRTP